MYVLAKSEGRQAKEIAMRRKKLARLLRKLRAMRRSCPRCDRLLMRVGAAKTDVGRAFGFVKINLPQAGQEVTKELDTFLKAHGVCYPYTIDDLRREREAGRRLAGAATRQKID